MDGRLRIILLVAALSVSGCRDEQTALMAPPDPVPAGASGADQAGPAVAAADSTTEAEECDLIEVEIEVDGETKTVYLCRRESEAAGGSTSAEGDGTQICWYWVVEYRIAGILVGTTEELLFCEEADDPNPGGGGGGDPGLTLACPESAKRAETVECSFTWSPSDAAISDISWEFDGGGQLNSKAGDNSWSGVAVADGIFRVSATVGGQQYRDSATIEVTERGGGAWIWEVSQGWDDAAVGARADWYGDDADAFGLTVAPATCHLDEEDERWWFEVSYTVSPGSGPWEGVYFVKDPHAPLILRAALRPEATGSYPTLSNRVLESKCGFARPSVTMAVANTICDTEYASVYEEAADFAEQHEDDHMNAGVIAALTNDLYASWDVIIGTSEDRVEERANAAAERANRLVNAAIVAVDNTIASFEEDMWYPGGGWNVRPIKFGH